MFSVFVILSVSSSLLSSRSPPLAMSSSRFHTFTSVYPPTGFLLLALSLPAATPPPPTSFYISFCPSQLLDVSAFPLSTSPVMTDPVYL